MTLSELKKGDSAKIIAINASEDLKRRLRSFGVLKGSELAVETYSLAKKTIEIMVDDTLIGLRAVEAEKITVEKITGGKTNGMSKL